jgi:hypothetical protein
MGRPDALLKPASTKVLALFPVMRGGPVSTETPSFYEGKSLFFPSSRPFLSGDSGSLTFERPTAATGAHLFPNVVGRRRLLGALTVLRLRPSGRPECPFKPLLGSALGDWAVYGCQRNQETAFHKNPIKPGAVEFSLRALFPLEGWPRNPW